MNAVILVAVVSVGNSSVYGCSRSLASLAVQGLLPKCVGYVDRAGRPLVAIMITNAFGLLGFLAADQEHQGTVFTWFFSICSLAAFFTWAAICFTHIRYRWALSAQGRSLDEVLFVSPLGIWGSFSGMIILCLIVVGEVWVSIFPIGESADVTTFWQNCLSLPLTIVLWLQYKITSKTLGTWMVDLKDIDLDTGRREMDVETLKQEIAEQRAFLKSSPLYYRIYRFWC
ncbi:S-adenosylmethionine permease gap4 [Clavispora lusitaniae]|nr:S-adenosylmethionine permease gap4 [Clavispora lusitaniae]